MMRLISKMRVAAVALAAVTAGFLVAGTVDPASAETSSSGAIMHGDACGSGWSEIAPDSGPHFDFHQPCHNHDYCYETAPYGRDENGRGRCDDNFRNDMRRSCDARYPHWYQAPAKAACMVVAEEYYWAVRHGGRPAFYS